MGHRTRNRVSIPPPGSERSLGPSALLRYFLTAGGWTYDAFADDVSHHVRRGVITAGRVGDWARTDVVPGLYRNAFLNTVRAHADPDVLHAWHNAFVAAWSEKRASDLENRRARAA